MDTEYLKRAFNDHVIGRHPSGVETSRQIVLSSFKYCIELDCTPLRGNHSERFENSVLVFSSELLEFINDPTKSKREIEDVFYLLARLTDQYTWNCTSTPHNHFVMPVIIEHNRDSDHIVYDLIGFPVSSLTEIKPINMRKFAKANFSKYRIFKTPTERQLTHDDDVESTCYSLRIDSEDLFFATLNGSMVTKDSLVEDMHI